MYKVSHRTVNFTLPYDDMPIDISFIFEREKPAGQHGFLKCVNGKFIFEDGSPARFWGTNFNSVANFPSHEYAEIVAKRLAKTGLNIVRFHQLDGDWATPNIFNFSKGRNISNTRTLDERSLDRLDYLIYALKKNGIYVYLDMISHRRFRTGDGIENAKHLPETQYTMSNFVPRMVELEKEYCLNLWSHYNPYTKLEYRNDPVIAMCEITNESNCVIRHERDIEPYRTMYEDMYMEWRKKQGLPPVERPVDFTDEANRDVVTFGMVKQKEHVDDMRAYLRSIDVKVPIAGSNWHLGGTALKLTETDMDFNDGHTYYCDWKWRNMNRYFKNSSMLTERPAPWSILPTCRLVDKPFFISEWDEPWPNEFRAEGPLHMAAACCLQGWAGAATHTYRYDCRPDIDMIAAPVTAEALNGVAFRSGVYDTFNDPTRYGLFYHAALMVRRGDMQESKQMSVLRLKGPMMTDTVPDAPVTPKDGLRMMKFLPCIDMGIWLGGFAVAAPQTKLPENAVELDPEKPRLPEDATMAISDTGEYRQDLKRHFALIDTPRTKVAMGFLAEAGDLSLKGVKIRCHNSFAVIAMSSLTDEPITESDNILLTAVGNADNTDAVYNENHTIQYSKGHGPIEAEVICAEIEIETQVGEFRVDAINDHGMQVGQSVAEIKDGKLCFSIGGDFASVYYLIQKI